MRVLYPIASGGQARVFAAVLESRLPDGSLAHHPIALKKPHDLTSASRDRFVREASLAAKLTAAHVVPVLGVADYDGVPSLVMPWVDGADLQALLQSEPLPPRIAVRIVLDAAAGLAELHERDVAHRDVAPDNILVGCDGIARIADFGLVRTHEHKSAVLSGKAAYVSPESIRGEPVDARADVFVLAAILVEAVLGRPWFRGASDAETLERVLQRPAPDRLDGAELLLPLLERALAKQPQARPADARALADELFFEARTAGLLGSSEEVRECVLARSGAQLDRARVRRHEAIASLRPRAAGEKSKPRRAPLLIAVTAAALVSALCTHSLWPRTQREYVPVPALLPTLEASSLPVEAPAVASGSAAPSSSSLRPPPPVDKKPTGRSAAPNPYRKVP